MIWKFSRTSFEEMKNTILSRIAAFPSIIDGYLVDHIIGSNHYRILVDGEVAGYFSIHEKSLLTQFSLDRRFSSISQDIYFHVRRMEQVHSAMVPTCDEYFLSHALDDARQVDRQAYFFRYDSAGGRIELDPGFHCRIAEASEMGFIRVRSGDFFDEDELPEMLGMKQVRISYYEESCVGFGLLIRSGLYPDVADLGMYTLTGERKKGYGRQTIQYLINECLKENLRISAGCWYFNHNSKKSLEHAGMYTITKLLKIKY